jgi:hypothetical protein
VRTVWALARRATLALALLAGMAGCTSCCWSAKQYRAAKLPASRPLAAHDPLRIVIDAPTIRELLGELGRRQPSFGAPFTVPPLTRKLGLGCRTPAFGDCAPCREYSVLSRCSPLRLRGKPCEGQSTQRDGSRLRWANETCPASDPDCALMVSGYGFTLAAERAAYEVTVQAASLTLGDGRLAATVDLGKLKVKATTRLTVLDRCGAKTRLPLVKLPEQCEGVEAGIDSPAPIHLEAGLVLESKGRELRGRLDGDVRLKLPPKGAYLKQSCYSGSVLGYDLGEMVQREGIGALEREWPRREAQAQQALTTWLAERLARPLVDAIPGELRVGAAGGQVTFFPHLERVAVTPAAITVQADSEVLIPYELVSQQLAALGKVRASRKGEDPLSLSDLKVEQGPGGTLLVRAAYEYQWQRAGVLSGGGRGQLAFAGRGELRGGVLRLGDVQLVAMDPSESGCFDDRVRRKVEAALQGDEVRRLEIKLQTQYEAAVDRLRAARLTRDGLSITLQADALTAVPTFERDGVLLHLGGNLRPRLAPAPARRDTATR